MSNTAVLPRIRRRRRRPPNRDEIVAMAWLSLYVMLLVLNLVGFAIEQEWMWKGYCLMICLMITFVARYFLWPTVWNYIRNGYYDD